MSMKIPEPKKSPTGTMLTDAKTVDDRWCSNHKKDIKRTAADYPFSLNTAETSNPVTQRLHGAVKMSAIKKELQAEACNSLV